MNNEKMWVIRAKAPDRVTHCFTIQSNSKTWVNQRSRDWLSAHPGWSIEEVVASELLK
jgi:hypothetical protein